MVMRILVSVEVAGDVSERRARVQELVAFEAHYPVRVVRRQYLVGEAAATVRGFEFPCGVPC